MKKALVLFVILFSTLAFSQEKIEFSKADIEINSLLKGTLYSPLKQSKKTNLVILIAGSGPTDRDGNQKGLTNNSLKLFAVMF